MMPQFQLRNGAEKVVAMIALHCHFKEWCVSSDAIIISSFSSENHIVWSPASDMRRDILPPFPSTLLPLLQGISREDFHYEPGSAVQQCSVTGLKKEQEDLAIENKAADVYFITSTSIGAALDEIDQNFLFPALSRLEQSRDVTVVTEGGSFSKPHGGGGSLLSALREGKKEPASVASKGMTTQIISTILWRRLCYLTRKILLWRRATLLGFRCRSN